MWERGRDKGRGGGERDVLLSAKNIFLLGGGGGIWAQGGGERDVLLSSAKNIFLLEGGRGRGKKSSMFSCPLKKIFLLERGRDRGRRAGSPVL